MANVGFRIGTQSDLNTILNNSSGVEGTFYLTSDTHRLYIGGPNGVINPVGQGIKICSTINDLPSSNVEQGQFYYVTTPNILCVRSGDNWVQINPDTNTTYNISATQLEVDGPYAITLTSNASSNNTQSTTETFYTATQVSNLITDATKTMNAMQYKNTIASTSALSAILSSNTNCIGDTYIVSADGVVYTDGNNNTTTFNTGDLIILNGTESGGYITTASIYVDGVPASSYRLDYSGSTLTLYGPGNTNCGSATISSSGSSTLTWLPFIDS